MRFTLQKVRASVPWTDAECYLVWLAIATVVTASILTDFAVLLQRNFLTVACDSAVIQNAIINTLDGHFFANNGGGGPNLLGSHTTFILLLVIPFYVVIPSLDFLFGLQVFGVYLTVIPLFLVAVKITQRPLVSLVIAASALASSYLLCMALAPLHYETWIASAVLWSYYFYLHGHLKRFVAGMLVAVCCGEQAALIYIALGASLLLVDDGCVWRKRFGTISLVSGLFWLALSVLVIAPYFGGGHKFNIFAYNYAQWHIHSVKELPLTMARHPFIALSFASNPFRWAHIFSLIGVPLIFALTSWRTIILLAPAPAYLMMSDQEYYLYFHAYYYTFAFIAGYLGLIFFLSKREPVNRVSLATLFAMIFANIFLLCPQSGYFLDLAYGAEPQFNEVLHEVFATIPSESTVYSPHRFSAYLSNRDNMVIGDLREANLDFDAMMEKRFDETNVHGSQVDFIISDFFIDQCGWRNAGYNADLFKIRSDNIDRLVKSGKWRVFWSGNGVTILQLALK